MSLLQTFSQLGKHKKTESESKVKECDEVKEATFEGGEPTGKVEIMFTIEEKKLSL